MKRSLSYMRYVFALVACGVCVELQGAGINFGSKNSAIKIASGAQLNVATSGLQIDNGTLKIASDDGSEIAGEAFSFVDGVFSHNSQDISLSASYNPTDEDNISLGDDDYLNAEPGTVVKNVYVTGAGRITGQPLFEHEIEIADSDAQLTMAIDNTLNQDINLNGGSLVLENNLMLADNVKVNGPGYVYPNRRRLQLGGYYSSEWSDDLAFSNAADINLMGKVDLTGQWTFDGISRINGHGAVLNVLDGGKIRLRPGAELNLEDVQIKGLGDSKGKFIFMDADGVINTSDVSFELDGSLSTTIGNLYVDGPSTMLLHDKNWSFEDDGKLTVGATTLWLDAFGTRGIPPSLGKLMAPYAVYDEHGYNGANVALDIAAGNLELLPTSTIRQAIDASNIFLTPEMYTLFSGEITTNLDLDRSLMLSPGQKITFAANHEIIIDGQGAILDFCESDNPQFVIGRNTKVTIQNIVLTRLTQGTFDLGRPGAELHFGENVVLGLSSDITLTCGKYVIDPLTGGDANSLTMYGLEGRKTFRVSNAPLSSSRFFQFGYNTLEIQNLEFRGLGSDAIQATYDNATYSPLLAILGNASVSIDADTKMNFMVGDTLNTLVVTKDNLRLEGFINFTDYAQNNLEIRAALTDRIEASSRRLAAASLTYPLINITGANGIVLAPLTSAGLVSSNGTATLTFSDPSISINNVTSTSFEIDSFSTLIANNINFYTNDVIQFSKDFTPKISVLGGNAGINTGGVRAMFTRGYPRAAKTGFNLKKARYENKVNAGLAAEKARQQKPVAQPKVKPAHKKGFDQIENTEVISRAVRTPVITEPTIYDTKYNTAGGFTMATAATQGNVLVDNSNILSNFYVDASAALTLVLKNGSILEQSSSNDIVLGTLHKIYVFGTGNKIKVTRDFFFKSNIQLADGAELTVELYDNGKTTPHLYFDSNCALSIPTGSVFTIKGPNVQHRGLITMQNGTTVTLAGTSIINEAGVQVITSRPRFVITEFAHLDVEDQGTARIVGKGSFELSSAIIDLDVKSNLNIGSSTSDDISIKSSGSIIMLSNQDPSALVGDNAKLQIGNMTSTIEWVSSVALIDDKGVLAINVVNNSGAAGNILEWSTNNLDGLFIDVRTGGTIQFADNIYDQDISDVKTTNWYAKHAKVTGTGGAVQFVNTANRGAGFIAKVSPVAGLQADITGTKFLTVAKLFCQKSSLLTKSLLFEGMEVREGTTEGYAHIYTYGGYDVTLAVGPSAVTIASESSAGTVTGSYTDPTTSRVVSFTVTADGTLTLS